MKVAIPKAIFEELTTEVKKIRAPWEFNFAQEDRISVSRLPAIRHMMTVAGAWSNHHAFMSEHDMVEKVTRYCGEKFKDFDGKQEDLKNRIPDRSQMLAAYGELRRRWPGEYAGGFDSLRLT